MDPTSQLVYAHPPENGLDALRKRINSRRRKGRAAASALLLIAAFAIVFWPNGAPRDAGPSEASIAHAAKDGQLLKIENGAAMEVPTDRKNVRLYWVMALNADQQADSGA